MRLFYVLITLAAGAAAPCQAGINAQLKTHLGNVIAATFTNFTIGALFLAVFVLASGTPFPLTSAIKTAPWWNWTGGFFGGCIVMGTVLAAPKLGALALMSTMITGQLVASVLLDHFGLLGYVVHPISLKRLAGVGLLALGVLLINKG